MEIPDPAGVPPLPPHDALVIAAVVIPAAGSGPGPSGTSTDFRDCQAMRTAEDKAVWGNLDRCLTDREAREYWRGTPYEERHLFLARIGGEPVGLCSVTLPLQDNTATAGIDVLVVPRWRRRGIGRALLCHAEAVAQTRGRSSLGGFHEIPLDALGQGAG